MGMYLSQIFGQSVIFNNTNKTITFALENFQNVGNGTGQLDGNGLDNVALIDTSNIDSYASKIFASVIMLHLKTQPPEDTDPTVGSYVEFSPAFKRFATRNSIRQICNYPTINLYKPDDTTFDVDDVV